MITEGMHGVCGMAAGEVRGYYDALTGPEVHMHICENPDTGYLTDAVLAEADERLGRAEHPADDGKCWSAYVRSALSVRYATLARMDNDAPKRPALLDEFERDIRRAGIVTCHFR